MAEKKEKKLPATSQKGKERIRKEKLVKKRKALREKEERRLERLSKKAAKVKKEHLTKENEPLIYVQVFEGGRKYETHSSVKMGMRKPWRKPNPEEICSTIPGSVVLLFVKEGDTVEKDQQIMMYEAMKMCNVIRAPFSGTVVQILVALGDKLPKGAPMMVIRASETADSNKLDDDPTTLLYPV